MATTPAKGWPYPVGTDFVVDGDNAMRAISEMLDARMGRYVITPTGVVNGTINADGSVTANAASGFVELRGIFTARFRLYVIEFDVSGTGSAPLQVRCMQGAAMVQAAGSYTSQMWVASGATPISSVITGATYGQVGQVNSALHSGAVWVYDPLNVASQTRLRGDDMGGGLPGGAGILRLQAAAEDGLAFAKGTGTTTGWLKVFGM